jgi:uncharacterized membrane protein
MQRWQTMRPFTRLRTDLIPPAAGPLAFSSLFAGSLLAVRILFSRQATFIFLGWNLFLAWLPYLFGRMAAHAHRRGRWLLLLPVAGLWLLFFPNAPYILTDFLHLAQRDPIPMWYDLLLLATFAWTGLFLAMRSLATMQSIVRNYTGPVGAWLFVVTALTLGSLGIYLGRFLRWNSWDLLSRPAAVLADVGTRLLHPLAHRQTYAMTILFSVFLFTCYLTLFHGPSEDA